MHHCEGCDRDIDLDIDPGHVKRRLEELRTELRAERISYGELFELQSLAHYIEDDDVELLEPAGVVEDAIRDHNQGEEQ